MDDQQSFLLAGDLVRRTVYYSSYNFCSTNRKTAMIQRFITWWRKYNSPEEKIKRLERYISNLESHIGTDYHNPLGALFDLEDSQEDFDNNLIQEIQRCEDKIKKLKKQINDQKNP